ncbi:MAG: DUF2254 domain-containing protein [Anaerolineae bacterium]|nr:DUF2254 domain-containing protein [Anaerolineae bacterium]
MPAKLQNVWENVSDSLWFVPTILALLAVFLSSILLEADRILAESKSPLVPFLFSGTADAARALLSVIAGSLITVISIVFSITIIALQQAASQFSPRVLRLFTANRSNQIIIGVYVATFIYSLLVLRSIRSQTESLGSGFVPALGVTVAIFLAVVCFGLLIYFLHHTSQSLQVGVIVDELRRDVIAQIDALYLVGSGEALLTDELSQPVEQGKSSCYIHSNQTGFVRKINEDMLLNASFGQAKWCWIRTRVGDFATCGGILAELDVGGEAEQRGKLADHIRAAFVIDTVPSLKQDPMFGIRQLVDIALKALSPGINDPTTAEHVLYHLGDILGRLAMGNFPPKERNAKTGQTRVIFSQSTWADFVEAAFSQIRREAADDVHVTSTLLQVLHGLALRLPPGRRSQAIRHQVLEIRRGAEEQAFSPADKSTLYQYADQVEQVLGSKVA